MTNVRKEKTWCIYWDIFMNELDYLDIKFQEHVV